MIQKPDKRKVGPRILSDPGSEGSAWSNFCVWQIHSDFFWSSEVRNQVNRLRFDSCPASRAASCIMLQSSQVDLMNTYWLHQLRVTILQLGNSWDVMGLLVYLPAFLSRERYHLVLWNVKKSPLRQRRRTLLVLLPWNTSKCVLRKRGKLYFYYPAYLRKVYHLSLQMETLSLVSQTTWYLNMSFLESLDCVGTQ